MKIRTVAVIFALLALIVMPGAPGVLAADVDMDGVKIPVIPEAQDIWGGVENMEINGIPAKGCAYASSGTMQEVNEFYQKQLSSAEWKFMQEWEGLNIRAYNKGDNYLYIASGSFIFPTTKYGGTDTKFAVILTKTPIRLCLFTTEFFNVESPGRDLSFIPRYPGSNRALGIIREDKEAFFIYIVRDDAAKIADFYAKNAPAYGWRSLKRATLPRTCIDAAFSATVLIFERSKQPPDRDADNLTIYMTYCSDFHIQIISVAYNVAFTYSATADKDDSQP